MFYSDQFEFLCRFNMVIPALVADPPTMIPNTVSVNLSGCQL